MFIGHTAVALWGKRARPAVPLAALVAATYGPDVIEITLLALWRWAKLPATFGSHSLPSVALGALVVGAAYLIWRRDAAGAALLSAIYASHWLADLLTGRGKPTWAGGPTVGLSLYDHPLIDFAVEAALFTAAWVFLWPAAERRRRPRVIRIVAPIGVVLLQLVFNISKPLFGLRNLKGAVSGVRTAGDRADETIVRTAGSTRRV